MFTNWAIVWGPHIVYILVNTFSDRYQCPNPWAVKDPPFPIVFVYIPIADGQVPLCDYQYHQVPFTDIWIL